MFGLRGCRLTEGTATGFVSAAQLSEDLPDHNDFHCVLGVWRRSSGQIALFQGSTVPNWRLMEGFRQGGERANLLPTGLYSYKVGTHRPNTRGAIPGAFIQQGEVTVARTLDDLVYTVHDLWEAGAVGDNIHPARLGRSGAGPFFSSAGCQTLPGNFGSGRHTGLWADFRSAAGLSPAVPRSENGRLYSYVLLTGRDARLAANNAVPSALVRLRFGSSGPDVQALQQGLKQSGQYRGAITGTLDAATSIAYVTWQQARDGGAADAIVTPALGRELGFDMVGQQSAAQSVRLGLGGQAVSAPTQSPSVGRTVALANSSGYASNGYSGNGHTGNGHSGNGHVEDTATRYPVNSSSNGRGARRERDVSSSYVPPNTFSLVDESFDHNVPGGVPIVAQPSGMTCWATVATMMLCWHNRPTVYTIQQAMDLAGAQYRARFDSNQGLSGAEKGQFLSAIGMRAEQQASYTPTALREMLLAYGPLWVTTDEDPSEGFAVHARIVTGIFSDGTPQGTFLRINDPAGGQQYNEVFTTFVRKYEDVAIGDVAGGSDPRIQIVHF
jgi:peptidoglycan hydrolase-like protein with peptidoglycan-binding domain